MISVVMTTCALQVNTPRIKYAKDSLIGLMTHLKTSEVIKLIIADDGTVPSMLEKLAYPNWSPIVVGDGIHKGLGSTLNLALTKVDTKLWIYLTDDWCLTKPLDLTPALNLIDKYDYDVVMLGHAFPFITCVTMHDDNNWWLDIQPECGGLVFGFRPFIATKAFYDRIGPFCDGVYEVEKDYSARIADAIPSPKIALLADLTGPWVNIGRGNSVLAAI